MNKKANQFANTVHKIRDANRIFYTQHPLSPPYYIPEEEGAENKKKARQQRASLANKDVDEDNETIQIDWGENEHSKERIKPVPVNNQFVKDIIYQFSRKYPSNLPKK